jgi:hypothetical protein
VKIEMLNQLNHGAGKFSRARRAACTIIGVLVAMFSYGNLSLAAAPLTFQFQANVASVLPTAGGAALPFPLSAGDELEVEFSFDPGTGGPQYPQASPLRVSLGGQVGLTAGFLIDVRNDDIPNAVPVPGSIADPANTPIVDLGPGASDNIFLSCVTSSVCGVLQDRPNLTFRPVIAFSHEGSLLNSEDLPTDPMKWNAFPFREMSLTFINNTTSGETYIGANIGTVKLIPELSTGVLAVAAVCTLFVVRRAAQH